MSEKKTTAYDPVTAQVPGVDQKMRADELKLTLSLGDPLPPKTPENLPDNNTKYYFGGHLKIVH